MVNVEGNCKSLCKMVVYGKGQFGYTMEENVIKVKNLHPFLEIKKYSGLLQEIISFDVWKYLE